MFHELPRCSRSSRWRRSSWRRSSDRVCSQSSSGSGVGSAGQWSAGRGGLPVRFRAFGHSTGAVGQAGAATLRARTEGACTGGRPGDSLAGAWGKTLPAPCGGRSRSAAGSSGHGPTVAGAGKPPVRPDSEPRPAEGSSGHGPAGARGEIAALPLDLGPARRGADAIRERRPASSGARSAPTGPGLDRAGGNSAHAAAPSPGGGVPVVMMTGSFSLVDIVAAQTSTPFIFLQPVSFAIFFVSAMAEIKRIPFDLPEAERTDCRVPHGIQRTEVRVVFSLAYMSLW